MLILPLRPIVFSVAFLFSMAALPAAAEKTTDARELINAMGCKGCHMIAGNGGTLGPALDDVGKRLNREEIRRQLTEPQAANPDSSMPAYGHLPESQLESLIDYLERLK